MANPKRQSGQAILLIAMLMIILLSSLGLAIDGGGMFLLWRDVQNAADAAAIQAAFAYCTSSTEVSKYSSAVAAGLRAADDNGFDNAGLDVGNNQVVVGRASTLDPSLVSDVYNYTDTGGVLLVEITANKPSYFIQLVYNGPLQVVARSVGVCSSGGSPFDGRSMYSMADNEYCGFDADDNSQSTMLDIGGSESHFWGSVASNGNVAISVSNGGGIFHDGLPYFVGGIKGEDKLVDDDDTSLDMTGADVGPVAYSNFPILFDADDFDSGERVQTEIELQYGVEAGFYEWVGTSGNFPTQPNTVLEGVYYFAGDVSLKGSNIARIGDRGVTIVARGTIQMNGLNGKALEPFYEGLLLFTDIDTRGNCTGNGNNGIKITNSIAAFGIIYAPLANVNWPASNTLLCGSSIAWTNTAKGATKWLFSNDFLSFEELEDIESRSPVDRIDIETEYLENDENWQRLADEYMIIGCDFIESAPPSYSMGSSD